MLYDELELVRMVKKGFRDISIQDEIKFNILNFIDCIHQLTNSKIIMA
jgi:hypothetical protein